MYLDGKNHALPSLPALPTGRQAAGKACTVATFWLKYQDRVRCLRRVTPTKLYRRAVSINLKNTAQIKLYILLQNETYIKTKMKFKIGMVLS
jgi:hypothetical protein